MPIISKSWSTDTYIEATSSTWTTLAGQTEEYSANVDLETNGYMGAQASIEIDFGLTPTDDVEVAVYPSLDGINYDNIPIFKFVAPNTIDPLQISLLVKDVAHFRLGFRQTGATNSHNVRAHFQAWRYVSA